MPRLCTWAARALMVLFLGLLPLASQTPVIRYVVVNYETHTLGVVGSNFGTSPQATFGGVASTATITNPTIMTMNVKVVTTQVANFALTVTNTTSAQSTTFYVDWAPSPYHWLGAWSGSTLYRPNDIVTYNGDVYSAQVMHTGKQPDANPTYWNLLSEGTITQISQGGTKTGSVKAVGLRYIIALAGIYPSGGGGSTTYSEQILGEVRLFAGTYAPSGWAYCEGQLLDISQNSALFNLLGTTYGGDGVNNFALPDLRAAVPMHANQ